MFGKSVDWRWAVVVVLVGVTLLCLPLRPLWVDEIFQLEGTWHQSYGQMVHNAMVAPGGMPLAYAAQKLWLDVAGFSPARARVPAAVFGLGTVLVIFWTARFLRLNAWLALALAFITPLLFRYATEARPYSQGLFFSALSTFFFVQWRARPGWPVLGGYFAACLAGVYSQPFALFLPCAHVTYLVLTRWRRALPIVAVVTLTGLLYAPWVAASRRALLTESWPHEMFFSAAQVSPLMILREISGGGYVCSAVLLMLAAWGLRQRRRRLLLFCVVVPVALAIAADAMFNYFFAIRQLIFVLPSLLLLATAGLDELWHERKAVAVALAASFITGALTKDVRWQMDRKENWASAAGATEAYLQEHHGCVQFLPAGDAKHYLFFRPELKQWTCLPGTKAHPVLTVISPYAPVKLRQAGAAGSNIGNSLLVAGAASK